MLVVDPLRRISITQIRQHPWFQSHLPRYLAVKPLSTIRQLEQVSYLILLLSLYILSDINTAIRVDICSTTLNIGLIYVE